MTPLKLKTSPRLFISRDAADNLKDKLHSPFLQAHAQRVIEDADGLVRAKALPEWKGATYFKPTRTVASYFQCLTAAWALTHEMKYRKAALRHLGNMMTWNHISCEARSNTPPEVDMPFCLSYGEHCADIGIMYDLFRSDITPEEQKVFFDVLDRFYLSAALNCLDNPPWWANTVWSNWNAVCCGGMGIMALAFYEDRPECRKLIPFVEKSLGEYFKSYINNGGGCHEGTGYCNYGMNYSMRYLLSWESATGKKHPAFSIKELGKALYFLLDFTGLTFGDNDGWHPCGYSFMLAKRLNQPHAALTAATYLSKGIPTRGRVKRSDYNYRATNGDLLFAADFIPSLKEMQELERAHTKKKEPVARVYKGLGWAALSDDAAFPRLRLTARGGSNEVTGHGMADLLSFKCMVNGERMITDQYCGGQVSFTKRGTDLYGRSPASKSTLFVNGLGCHDGALCNSTEVVKGRNILGIRIDGSQIYLPRWAKLFIGRLFLMVDSAYWLVIDRVFDHDEVGQHWMEARFHTFADCKSGKDWVSLKSGKERMMMTFASLNKGIMQESRGMPSSPGPQTNIYRWMSAKSYQDNLLVTALNPGSKRLGLKVNKQQKVKGYTIEVTLPGGKTRTIRLTPTLKLQRT